MFKATTNTTRLGLPAFALVLAAAGAATGPGGSAEAHQGDQPLRCEITVLSGPAATTYQGRVQAVRAVSGSYAFTLAHRSGGGISEISQNGDFSLRPGEIEVLGEATFGGQPGLVDAALTLTVGGKMLRCVLDDTI